MERQNNKLVDLSVAFAVEILNLVKYLKSQHEAIICNHGSSLCRTSLTIPLPRAKLHLFQ